MINYEFVSEVINGKRNVNALDDNDKTAAIYLAESENYEELVKLIERGANYNFVNSKNESVLSVILNKMRKYCLLDVHNKYSDCLEMFERMGDKWDMDVPLDEDNNTAIMVLLLSPRLESVVSKYLSLYNNINLSKKNKYGDSFSSLLIKLNLSSLYDIVKYKASFEHNYVDRNNGNTLFLLSVISQPTIVEKILKRDKTKINDINFKKENALIIATKAGCIDTIKILLKNNIYINQQDKLGNTALHYAIQSYNPYTTALLVSSGANLSIKNLEGETPMNFVNKIKNEIILKDIVNAIQKPFSFINEKDIGLFYESNNDSFNYLIPELTINYRNYEIHSILENRKIIYRTYRKSFSAATIFDIVFKS
ncbi:hypothetical protein PIROE2DRAFT_11615 [Piromyces sp. E2]|nr:hypothetical protein PIROE2DRAFT_11615 [Piromyces sp. E2]|eukprot:OUM62167.1 hypothetical protein PIROE2DRAFT_11615 [Piromyces sp. E2]